MKTDADIEAERAALEPLIGPTRAGWYAEACRMEYDHEPEEALLWACRYREMAMEAGRLEAQVAAIREAADAAREEQREADAKVLEELCDKPGTEFCYAVAKCAAAIRGTSPGQADATPTSARGGTSAPSA